MGKGVGDLAVKARRARRPGRPASAAATYLYAVVQSGREPESAGAPPGLPGTGPLRF